MKVLNVDSAGRSLSFSGLWTLDFDTDLKGEQLFRL